MKYLKGNLLLLFLCFWSISQAQFNIPDIPEKQTSIYDAIDLLSKSQSQALEQKLIKYSDSTSTQIVVAIIRSTEGENITYLGANWLTEWGIGQKGKDNGVLILLARDDRKIAINTGYGVEGSLTDAMSRRIIETVIIPKFKQNDYYGGLNKGSDAIFNVLNGEFTEDRSFTNEGIPFEAFLPFIIFFIILIILWNRKGNNDNNSGGRRGSGFDLRDIIILSNMGRGSSSSGSFGSGGSFGGGGFSGGFGGGMGGGGGASGGW